MWSLKFPKSLDKRETGMPWLTSACLDWLRHVLTDFVMSRLSIGRGLWRPGRGEPAAFACCSTFLPTGSNLHKVRLETTSSVSNSHFFADPGKNIHAVPDPGGNGKKRFFTFQMILKNFHFFCPDPDPQFMRIRTGQKHADPCGSEALETTLKIHSD